MVMPKLANLYRGTSSELLVVIKILMATCATFALIGIVSGLSEMAIVFGGAFILTLCIAFIDNTSYFVTMAKHLSKIGIELIRDRWIIFELERRIAEADKGISRAKNTLYSLKTNYQMLESEKARAINSLKTHVEQKQKDAFLSSRLLRSAVIPGIGPSRVYTLEYYGIESAYDIDQSVIEQIPGFGEQLTARLVAWRHSVESEFWFDKSKGLPLHDLQSIDLKFEQRKLHMQKGLVEGERALKALFDKQLREIQEFIDGQGFSC